MGRGMPCGDAATVIALAAAFLGACVVQAAAQEPTRVGRDGFREGVPAVLSPPRPPRPPAETPFAAAYRRAGQPRMVLFFNRDIADTPTSQAVVRRQEVVTAGRDGRFTLREQGSPPQARVATPEDGTAPKAAIIAQDEPRSAPPADSVATPRQVEIEDRLQVQTERRSEVRIERQPIGARTAPMDEGSQWQFETGFTRRLATERVRMVDRAAAVRISVAARSIADPQQLEIAAIREHAEIAVLVRAAPMPAAHGGLIYRVTAVDVRRGTILADEVVSPPSNSGPADIPNVTGDLAAAALMSRLQTEWTPLR
jgi:hypothetical protein